MYKFKNMTRRPDFQKNYKSSSYADNDAFLEMKRKAIFGISGQEFHALLEKIQSTNSTICQNNIEDSYLIHICCPMLVTITNGSMQS